MLRNRRGFTLIELIIVVILIAILSSIAAPVMRGNVDKARRSEAIATCGALRTAARLWMVENPTGTPDLNDALNAANMTVSDLTGPNYAGSNYSISSGVIQATGKPGTVTMRIDNGTITPVGG
jgi:prepilin-type N-terminal cleavage/methylation domain-containing protein